MAGETVSALGDDRLPPRIDAPRDPQVAARVGEAADTTATTATPAE